MVHQVTSTTDEIERLRRENAGLELECAAWRQSSALKLDEIDRLREQCKGLAQSALNNGQDLLLKETEIERLRAALDEIVMTCTCDAIETARAALEGKP
jgi:chromosome segregation ATPase